MCGFAGFIDDRPVVPAAEWPALLTSIGSQLRHRGPDDSGQWMEIESGVGFSFRRLSIIDLSPLGHQPMHSADGRYVLMFNGEIYNFERLRDELAARGHPFRGRSDTEVMLAAFVEWGVPEATSRFNGMFAFALWDRAERSLYLGRDRVGEKPLYYGWSGGVLLFGSELKALRIHPAFTGQVDPAALDLFLRFGYVPSPHSIYKGVHKVAPATIVRFRAGQQSRSPEVIRYWSSEEVARRGETDPFTGSVDQALDQLEELLIDSVRLRMIADVPLGAFLSGGIDSSLVVSLMRRAGSDRIRTFSIGFREDEFDESKYAAEVARHLGTEHTEAIVSPADAMSVIPLLPRIYDEPFADSSQIPTYLVARLARSSVTVSLSGDGGDELFGGYNRYVWGLNRWRSTRMMPGFLLRGIAGAVEKRSIEQWNRWLQPFARVLPGGHSSPGEKVHKLATLLRAEKPEQMYAMLMTFWRGGSPAIVPPGANELPTVFSSPAGAFLSQLGNRMMYLDLLSYLPDDILVKVDRATMAVSLEARVPLLDHRVVEFAARIPLRWKIRRSRGKWLLRRLLDRYVPRPLVDRPKMGFGVPIERWLRGPLRPWVEALIDESRLRNEGFLDPSVVRAAWREYLAGRGMWHAELWNVLMFQAWLEASRAADEAIVSRYSASY